MLDFVAAQIASGLTADRARAALPDAPTQLPPPAARPNRLVLALRWRGGLALRRLADFVQPPGQAPGPRAAQRG